MSSQPSERGGWSSRRVNKQTKMKWRISSKKRRKKDDTRNNNFIIPFKQIDLKIKIENK